MSEVIKPKFVIGQTVRLKSGGRDMTIDELEIKFTNPYKEEETKYFTGYVKCAWFESDKLHKNERFHQDMLELTKVN